MTKAIAIAAIESPVVANAIAVTANAIAIAAIESLVVAIEFPVVTNAIAVVAIEFPGRAKGGERSHKHPPLGRILWLNQS